MTMNGVSVRSCFVFACCLVCLLLRATRCVGQQSYSSEHDPSSALTQFLRTELEDPEDGVDKATRISTAVVESDGNSKMEIVVYISGGSWCGSGGCRLLILEPNGRSFKVIGETTITRPPIRVLRTQSNGHFDIGVWVQGGGIQPGHEAILRFDGKSYPSNPSVASAVHHSKKVPGKVLIARDDPGILLYK
jgi:hypothetical protein